MARLANMPVATLRIWEQRHQAVRPATTSSGHRLYSPADVQRVLLLRQLTQQGHAIGSIAALDFGQLQQLAGQMSAACDAGTRGTGRSARRGQAAVRLVVIGTALAARLQRPAVARQLRLGARRTVVFESLSEAVSGDVPSVMGSAKGADVGAGPTVLLWHATQLRPEGQSSLLAAQQAWGAERVAVVYRHAASAATRALADAGAALLREPADDQALGLWLASVEAGLSTPGADGPADDGAGTPPPAAPGTLPARRYDDATLTTLAGLPSTLACECPRHVAELLMQLSSFEAYSAGCIHRDSADAQLHGHLQQVAATSRALFEAALDRLVRHERLSLR